MLKLFWPSQSIRSQSTWLTLGLCLGWAMPAGSEPSVAMETIAPSHWPVVDALIKVLKNEKLAPTSRRAAVTGLLSIGSPQAITRLQNLIDEKAPASLLRTLLCGLGQSQLDLSAHPSLLLKVSQLLGHLPVSLSDDLGFALGSFEDKATRLWLINEAKAQHSSDRRRGDAILALGYQRHKQVAHFLITELKRQSKQGESPLQEKLIVALGELSGLGEQYHSLEQWKKWWASYRVFSDAVFIQKMNQEIAISRRARGETIRTLKELLVQSQTKHFWAVGASEKQKILIQMLDNTLVQSSRIKALSLILEIQTKEKISPSVWSAVYRCLEDPSSQVRGETVRLIEDLGDKPGALLIAKRIQDQIETHKEVQRLSLQMLKRYPSPELVDPALRFLANKRHIHESAALLARIFETQGSHLPPIKKKQAAHSLHKLIVGQEPNANEAGLVYLLGSLAALNHDQRDWQLIQNWLGSKHLAIKTAAVRVWVNHNRSLVVLSQMSDDPVIQSKLIPAVTLRGKQTQTLMNMLKHRPKEKTIEKAWLEMLLVLAGRVPLEGLRQAEHYLAEVDRVSPSHRIKMIDVGLNRIKIDKQKTQAKLLAPLTMIKIDLLNQTKQSAQALKLAQGLIQSKAVIKTEDVIKLQKQIFLSALRLGKIQLMQSAIQSLLKNTQPNDQAQIQSWLWDIALDQAETQLKKNAHHKAKEIIEQLVADFKNKILPQQQKRIESIQKKINAQLIKEKKDEKNTKAKGTATP